MQHREGSAGHNAQPAGEPTTTAAPKLVRPYTLTAGRTESHVELPLEATVQAEASGAPRASWPANDVRGQLLARCADGPSVAELAARLSVPLGVARVLVGDLVAQGYLRVHATLGDTTTDDERRDLIGRTLRGLRAL